MKDFFKSVKFKIIIGLAVLCLGFIVSAVSRDGFSIFASNLISVVTSPIAKFSTSVTVSVTGVFDRIMRAKEISNENLELREQIRKLTAALVEFEDYKTQNEQYKDYLELKSENEDFIFSSAMVIGRDPTDAFGAFTIDKGSLDGVNPRDPVITPDGLVGIITEVSATSSKVKTMLDVAVDIGVFEIRTKEAGVITGDASLAQSGNAKLTLIPRDSGISAGDILISSGIGGIYPQGLVVGTIEEVYSESRGISLYAVVKPSSDIFNIKSVFVITDFKGKGN